MASSTVLILYITFHMLRTEDIFYYPMNGGLSSNWQLGSLSVPDLMGVACVTLAPHSENCPLQSSACWAVSPNIDVVNEWCEWWVLSDWYDIDASNYTNIQLSYQIRTINESYYFIGYSTDNETWKAIIEYNGEIGDPLKLATDLNLKGSFSNWDPSQATLKHLRFRIAGQFMYGDHGTESCTFNEFKLSGDLITKPTTNPTKQSTSDPLTAIATSNPTHVNNINEVTDDPQKESNKNAFSAFYSWVGSTIGLFVVISILVGIICAVNCIGIYFFIVRRRKRKKMTQWSENVEFSNAARAQHYAIASSITTVNLEDLNVKGIKASVDLHQEDEDEKEEQFVTQQNSGEAQEDHNDDNTHNSDDEILSEGVGLTTGANDPEIEDDYKEDALSHDGDSDSCVDAVRTPNTKNIMSGLLGSQSMGKHMVADDSDEDDDNVLLQYVMSKSPGKHGKRVLPSTEDVGEAMEDDNLYTFK